jgi:hypothetical protein
VPAGHAADAPESKAPGGALKGPLRTILYPGGWLALIAAGESRAAAAGDAVAAARAAARAAASMVVLHMVISSLAARLGRLRYLSVMVKLAW